MRLYTFTHYMLSPMAKGIQATHSTVELFNKYTNELDVQGEILYDWSMNHKTMVSLNGGVTPDLHNLVEFLEYGNCPYPWAYFNEDESLGDLLTSISLVLPEKIYEMASLLRTKVISNVANGFVVNDWEKYNESFSLNEYEEIQKTVLGYGPFSEFDLELISKLNTYRLASV